MTDSCSKQDKIDDLAGAVARLEERDEFKDKLLNNLEGAIGKIEGHMAEQTALMTKVAVQQEQISGITGRVDQNCKEINSLNETLTAIRLEPARDAKTLKRFSLQSLIGAIISGVVGAGTALVALILKT